jgi:hypothetical protein
MLTGEAFSVETYVAVHWARLAFPFAPLILKLILLVATMFRRSKGGSVGI